MREFRKIFTDHGPSAILLLGYFLFYSQILFKWWTPGGITALFLYMISIVVLGVGFWFALHALGDRLFSDRDPWFRVGALTLLTFLAIAFISALKPSHLVQESDFANYHLMLPVQHWVTGTWTPIDWSAFEFRALLLQYGYSFLWVGLPLLNKFPQYLFLLFFLVKLGILMDRIVPTRSNRAWLQAALAVFAFRGIAIQAGMSMLDLTSLYFFLSIGAFLCLWATRSHDQPISPWEQFFFGVDVAAYLGHKSFGFFFLGVLLMGTGIVFQFLLKKNVFTELKNLSWKWILLPITLLWIPNIFRSFYYSGDPFFPVLPMLTDAFCKSDRLPVAQCGDLSTLARRLQTLIANYGYGHDLKSFLKTLWVVAFPIDGPTRVNNIFDYPLGVFWFPAWLVLLWGAFRASESQKIFRVLLIGSFTFFCLWFMGSQQSRWLFPVLLFLAIGWGIFASTVRVALIAVIGLVAINGIRVVRSQRQTITCWGESCLATRGTYLEDFHAVCGSEPVVLDHIQEKGYFRCSFVPKERRYEF